MQRSAAALWVCLAVTGCGGGSMAMTPSFVAVHNTMAAMGLVQSGEISEGSLAEGGVARVTTPMRAGDCYTIVGLGGSGVADLDVVVLDDTGTEVATDHTQTGQAAAQFCPDVDGEYQVAVRMTHGNGSYVVTSWSGMPRGGGGAASGGSGTRDVPGAHSAHGRHPGSRRHQPGHQRDDGDLHPRRRSARARLQPHHRAALAGHRHHQLRLRRRALPARRLRDERSEISCNDDAPTTARSEVAGTLDPGTYYVVVDGYGNGAGEFELSAQATDLQSVAQVCQSAATLTPGQAVTGSTAGQPSYFTATCAGGARSADRVYAVDVPSRSRMRVRMQSTYDAALYVRRSCEDRTPRSPATTITATPATRWW